MEKKRVLLLIEISILIIAMISAVYYIRTGKILGFAIFESQPGAEGTDSYISQDSDDNLGSDPVIEVGKTAGGYELRGLINYNATDIEGETITSAIMMLHVSYSSNSNNITLKVYRITSQWNELEVGWTKRTSAESWGAAGGDYSELLDSVQIAGEGWYNFTITSAVRSWINGTYENYGMILMPEASNSDFKDIDSSDSADPSLAPKIIIEHFANAPPSISSLSTDTSAESPKNIGEDVEFTIYWADLENDNAQAFVCNSSSISASGCSNKTFCSTPLSSENPITCSYTITSAENKTQEYYVSVCDTGNCSSPESGYFYMNHAPNVEISQPNGNEIINQSQGNYAIKFNSSDADSDSLTASIYYGESQNSTSYVINSISLASYCTDADSSTATANNCSYSWNTTGIFGAYYLTIILNDSYQASEDSSESSFNVRSLVDSTAPRITAYWIEEGIYSGKSSIIYANITEEYLNSAWVSFNFSLSNRTMSNTSLETYNASFTAPAVGTYKYKIYARDTTGNLNSTDWREFSVSKPDASSQNDISSLVVLPYSAIKITAKLNSSQNLRDVYAYLTAPSDFTFLSGYSQNLYLGNFSAETKTATWFVSAPLTEADYYLNATYTDYYSNSWNSSNMNIQVTSSVSGYSLSVSGYPEVETTQSYYSEANFLQNGINSNPDSITISLYDSLGNLISGPASMTLKSAGKYNYSYAIGASVNEGQWETRINATKSGASYYANQFWKVVGGPFDIRSITVDSSAVDSLAISVTTENTGGANKDLTLAWNLTRMDNGQLLDSGADTFMVPAASTKVWTINPSTDYVGQVKIAFMGYYSGTEKAGAYKVFSTTAAGSSPVTPPSTGGAAGGGGGGAVTGISDYDISLESDSEISITKNIEKVFYFKINNIGKKQITNITPEFEGIDKKYYTISPVSLGSLDSGKFQEFAASILASDLSGDVEFNYLVKTNEITRRFPGKISVLEIEDFLKSEINRLHLRVNSTIIRINSLENEELSTSLLSDIETCGAMIKIIESYLDSEEFLNANSNIKEADLCIDKVDAKIKEPSFSFMGWLKKIKLPEIKIPAIPSMAPWILVIAVIAVVICALIVIVYILYKKLSLVNFMKTEKPGKYTDFREMKQKVFEEKIKSIERQLDITENSPTSFSSRIPDIPEEKEESEEKEKKKSEDKTEL